MVKESTDFVIFMDINSINDHSPWWARAFAIFLGFMLLLTVANFFYLEIFGINGINHYTFADAPQDPGVYPGNGTEEEQRNYNNSLREWEDYQKHKEMMDDLEESYVTEISQIFAVLTILIGIPTIAMFWTQHEKMLHFGLAFGAVSIIGEVWKAYSPLKLLLISWKVFPEEEIMLGLLRLLSSRQVCVEYSTSLWLLYCTICITT